MTRGSKFAQDIEGATGADATVPDELSIEGQSRQSWSNEIVVPEGSLTQPYMTLTQGNSSIDPELAPVGGYYVEGFGSFKNPIIVPLQFGMSRRYSRNNEKNQPIVACYAPTEANFNNLHGVAKEDDGPGMLCAECSLQKWTAAKNPDGSQKVDKNGNAVNNPPLCKEAFDYIAWSVDHGIFVKVSFRGGSIKVGKLIAQLGQAKGLGNFAVRLGSEKRTDPFVFQASTVTILKDAEAAEHIAMAGALQIGG